VRRVRVRPEFASLYPEVVPSVWMSATKAARLIRLAGPKQERVRGSACRRLMCELHFEFRGGRNQQERTGAWQSRAEYSGPQKVRID
jgi:hypothetical protein